jgi:hypothetical protein
MGAGPAPTRLAVSYRLTMVLMLAAAPRRVACCRAGCPASAPAPVITPGAGARERPVPACTGRPGVPPIRTLSTTASTPVMVRN